MMSSDPLRQFVAGDTSQPMVRHHDATVLEKGEGSIQRGNGNTAGKGLLQLGGRARPVGTLQGSKDETATTREANAVRSQPVLNRTFHGSQGLGRTHILRIRMILKTSKRLGIGPALVLTLIVGACSGTTTPLPRPLVVVSTTVWGDLASSLIGDKGSVEVLMPIGADPHDFRPSAKQVALLDDADLVIVNGLGLEEGLGDVIDSLSPASVLTLGPLLTPIEVADTFDPHVWLDPQRAMRAVDLIAGRLGELDWDLAGHDWQQRAADYKSELRVAMLRVEELLGQVAPQQRHLVTQHDSLRYLAAAYGYEIVGTLVEGGSTLAQPSSQHLADIIALIEERSVPAIFVDAGEPTSLADSAAEEVGGVAVVELYTGTLGGPGSGAETYVDMMIVNGARIAEALGTG